MHAIIVSCCLNLCLSLRFYTAFFCVLPFLTILTANIGFLLSESAFLHCVQVVRFRARCFKVKGPARANFVTHTCGCPARSENLRFLEDRAAVQDPNFVTRLPFPPPNAVRIGVLGSTRNFEEQAASHQADTPNPSELHGIPTTLRKTSLQAPVWETVTANSHLQGETVAYEAGNPNQAKATATSQSRDKAGIQCVTVSRLKNPVCHCVT